MMCCGAAKQVLASVELNCKPNLSGNLISVGFLRGELPPQKSLTVNRAIIMLAIRQ